MQHLNLLDQRLLPPKQVLTAGLIASLVGLGLLAVVVHATMARDVLRDALRASLNPVAEVPVDSVPPEHLALQARLVQTQALAQAMGTQDELPAAPGEALQRLLRSLPAQAWLTEVELGPKGGLTLAGGTLDVSVLPAFTQAAAQAAGLQGRAVEVLRLAPRPVAAEAPAESMGASGDGPAMKPLPAHLFSLSSVGAERGTP